ncbi:unnamed protein product [Linum tenue]|nr:unnamed protein product [Linum tenue]
MFLHMRAAAEDFCEIMERYKERFTGGVTHSFTGSADDRDKFLAFRNMYIVVRDIPIQHVKSSWPFRKKEKYERGSIVKGRNEPCLVRQVLEVVAGCKGFIDTEEMIRIIYQSTCRMFFPQDLDSAADSLLAGGDQDSQGT